MRNPLKVCTIINFFLTLSRYTSNRNTPQQSQTNLSNWQSILGKGKESDPTDASVDTSANASVSRPTVGWQLVDSRSTVGRQTADCRPMRWPLFELIRYKMRRWRVGDYFGSYGTCLMLNIPFPNWTEMSSTENFHWDSNYEIYFWPPSCFSCH